ncbi:MAG: 3D-(3,5/4)-trihydroxycyclohexane-1,2-dione acylhydrolase (decyclizing) [Actinomycetota bacterium]|nr:3D-(3,5/4)-trihydroxycyclohexane-1,2-dione acylhydrolase (decyclizing) [Actinomycetota bacterium]
MPELTVAQALIRFLAAQHTARDGREQRFIEGCFGIFGHGNVAGIGQALQQEAGAVRYYQGRNEQTMVHVAAGFARASNRLRTLACTSSVGPGATNMVTGAALATINRLPVLLLPGDVFATRRPHPVLQGLERPESGDASVNDAFRDLSRYWDRITRPEQLMPAALEAMRVLTDQAETGAVTLALPEDVQAETMMFPEQFFDRRVWRIWRQPLPEEATARAAQMIRGAQRPLIVAGGGVIYSEASEALRAFARETGMPVAETQAGKGSMRFDDPSALGAIGATGTSAANRIARDADVVLGIGTRWSDFTTASHSAFQQPDVRFISLNVAAFDAGKLSGLPLVGDARAGIVALQRALEGTRVSADYAAVIARERDTWRLEVERLYSLGHAPLPSQAEVIGAVERATGERDVVVCAAGSMPGDLHKLWRTRTPGTYHVEYGYSCMGYEIPGGLGVKLADPGREVYVMIGDGSYLMASSEIVTAIQERMKLTIVLVDNSGFASIGALSRSVGSEGFGTLYRYRENGSLGLDSQGDGRAGGGALPVDLGANAASLGAHLIRATTVEELDAALAAARTVEQTVVIHIPTDRHAGVPSYDCWWDVPVAAVSESDSVREARHEYERMRKRQRDYVRPTAGEDG